MRYLTCATVLAAFLVTGCSAGDALRVAISDDPSQALRQLAEGRAESYRSNPLNLVRDVRRAHRQAQQLLAVLRGEVAVTWGEAEVRLPGPREYVKYTQNYRSRAIVDFDGGTVTVETVDTEAPERSLQAALVTTLLTPEDPRAADLYSAGEVRLSGTPYLSRLVTDQHGRPVDRPARAEGYADYLMDRRSRREANSPDGPRTVHYVRFTMVNDFRHRQAERYAPLVERFSTRYGVSRSLVYAVIATESSFNPFAVSSAPAYGLMQLVPASGGRDAFRLVQGYDHVPSREYLFDPERNIELGSAYLSLLQGRYLAAVRNPLAREYCTIAAYNGGAGNVLDLFAADRKQAVRVINGLSPAQVYQRLRDEHPRAETRRYLVKVLDARRDFVSL